LNASETGVPEMSLFTEFRRVASEMCLRSRMLPIAGIAAIMILEAGTFADEQVVPAKPVTKARPAVTVESKSKPSGSLEAGVTKLLVNNESTPKAATTAKAEPATHTRQTDFFVKGHDDKGWLQAFAVDSKGRLLAAVGSKATYGIGASKVSAVTREVQVFSAEGKPLEHWPLDFDPQRITVGPNDEVFVAGSGKIARLDKNGKQIAQVDSPHIAAVLGDPKSLRESAEQQRKQMIEIYTEAKKSMEIQKEQLTKRIAALEEEAKNAEENAKNSDDVKNVKDGKKDTAKPAAKETAQKAKAVSKVQLNALKRQLTQNEAQLKSYDQIIEQQENRSVDEIVQEIKSRLQKINAIAVSGKNVFITTGIAKGYGFAVWRTDLEFKDAKQIVTNLSGCCGQMDVQVIGGELFIAENTRHRVGRFDLDGKSLATFGTRDRESAGACFGGCCNPMNVCLGPNGTVLTAESEGFVKSFKSDGTFVGLIGKAQVGGGCKNVSIATSPDGNRVYFYDLDKSRVVVMAREKPTDDAKPKTTARKD